MRVATKGTLSDGSCSKKYRDGNRSIQFRYVSTPGRSNFDTFRFEGWPILAVTLEPGDGKGYPEHLNAIQGLQRSLNRTLALIKYGSPSTRRLTRADRYSVKLSFKIEHKCTQLLIDGTRAANTFAKELAIQAVKKLPPGLLTVTALAIACILGTSHVVSTKYSTDAEIRKAEIEASVHHRHFDVTEAAIRHADTDAQNMRALITAALPQTAGETNFAKNIQRLERQSQVFQYAMSEVELWRPALLDLAPLGGSIDFNGLTLDSRQAKAMAKAATKATRKVQKAQKARPIETGWTTTVKRNKPISS